MRRAIVFLSIYPLLASASDLPVFSGDEVVVTSSRIPQMQKESLNSTTVITQEEIRSSQAVDVVTILRSVPGVEISQNGGMGNSAYLFLRGSSSSEVLVLVDGVRINSATNGMASIQDLMLDQIERIEVVRGNVSSLYGSDAIGGVVQIFTRRGRGTPGFNLSAGYGSLGTSRAAAGFGGAMQDTDFNVQLSRFKTAGISAINPSLAPGANPGRDGYDNVSFSGNVHYFLSDAHSLSATVFQAHSRNQFDSAFGLPTDVNNNKDRVGKVSLVSDNRFTDSWQSHWQWARGIDDQLFLTNSQPSAFGSRYQTTNRQWTWQNAVQINGSNRLLLGGESLAQMVSSDVAGGFAVTRRNVNSYFGGFVGQYGAHQLQLNLREDRNSQYGHADTGLIGYGFSVNDSWRATANYSTAFKAPTFNELYYPGFGNANLLPEHSRNAEAGLHYAAATQKIDAVYFDNRIRDLIVYAPLPVNQNQARIDGVELSYSGQFSDTQLNASLTSQNPRDLTSGTQLVRRARLHGSLGVSEKMGDWKVGGEWIYSGKRPDNDIASGAAVMLGSYNVFNLTVNCHLEQHIGLSLRADNLRNERYMLAQGYNTPGRTLFFAVNYQ